LGTKVLEEKGWPWRPFGFRGARKKTCATLVPSHDQNARQEILGEKKRGKRKTGGKALKRGKKN